jgi:tellurium resistance protein TerD
MHSGDNRDGAADGDDETLTVDASNQVANWSKIKFVVTINDAEANNQNFGQVSNSYIRILDATTNVEIVKYDLNEDFSIETALEFGEIYLNGTDVKFRAIGTGQKTGLASYCTQYGVSI